MKTPFLLCALGASLLLAGCGGGGGGPTTPVPTNTPTPTQTAVPRVFTPNYIGDIATIRRWRQFPLSVSFVRDAAYTTAAQQRALDGFNFWLQAISNGPTLTVVPASQESNLTVTFYQFDPRTSTELGKTRVFSSAPFISRAEMRLGITGNDTLDIATAAHEYGHALGIVGHSRNPDDLMFVSGNDNRSGRLTSADINTLLTVYNGDFPKNNGNRLAPIPGPFESFEIE